MSDPTAALAAVEGVSPNELLTVRYFTVAMGTVVIWEHLLHLRIDARFFYALFSLLFVQAQRGWVRCFHGAAAAGSVAVSGRQRRRIMVSDIILVIVRYAQLWYLVAGFLFYFARPASCDAVRGNVFTASIVGFTAMNTLFLYRVWVIWGRAWWPVLVLGPFLLADFVVWLVVAGVWNVVDIKAIVPAPFPGCVFSENPKNWHGLNWTPRLVFEVLACLLTVWRLYTLPKIGTSQDMRTWIRRSTLVYFGLTSAIYLTGLIGGNLGPSLQSGIIWSTTAQVMPLVVGVRVILATPSRKEESRERKGRLYQPNFPSAGLSSSSRGAVTSADDGNAISGSRRTSFAVLAQHSTSPFVSDAIARSTFNTTTTTTTTTTTSAAARPGLKMSGSDDDVMVMMGLSKSAQASQSSFAASPRPTTASSFPFTTTTTTSSSPNPSIPAPALNRMPHQRQMSGLANGGSFSLTHSPHTSSDQGASLSRAQTNQSFGAPSGWTREGGEAAAPAAAPATSDEIAEAGDRRGARRRGDSGSPNTDIEAQ